MWESVLPFCIHGCRSKELLVIASLLFVRHGLTSAFVGFLCAELQVYPCRGRAYRIRIPSSAILFAHSDGSKGLRRTVLANAPSAFSSWFAIVHVSARNFYSSTEGSSTQLPTDTKVVPAYKGYSSAFFGYVCKLPLMEVLFQLFWLNIALSFLVIFPTSIW